MRLLFARVGRTFCRTVRRRGRPRDGRGGVRPLAGAVAGRAAAHRLRHAGADGRAGGRRPRRRGRGRAADETAGELPFKAAQSPGAAAVDALRRKGFGRLLVDGVARTFEDLTPADYEGRPSLAVVVDRLTRRCRGPRARDRRGRDRLSGGRRRRVGGAARRATARPTCATSSASGSSAGPCGLSYEDPQPRLFSFNNPFGACPTCHGFGNIIELDLDLVVPDPAKTLAARRHRAVVQAALPVLRRRR